MISGLDGPYRVHQFRQAVFIHIADREHFEIIRTKVHHMKSRAFRH
jgi:hypothetical protein